MDNMKQHIHSIINTNKVLTIVGKYRAYTSAEKPDSLEYPPNITAFSSSIIVTEKYAHGGGLDPFTDGDDHDPNGRERQSQQ